MQPIKDVSKWLSENTNENHYLFTNKDLRCLLPQLSDSSFKVLLNRTVKQGLLARPCRGVYLHQNSMPADGLLLFHIAALLRANNFNYISLETALSDSGVISQNPYKLYLNYVIWKKQHYFLW